MRMDEEIDAEEDIDFDEYNGFTYGNEPDIPFKLHASYEEPGSTKLVMCAKCGATKLEVGQGSYYTVVRCPNCHHESCIHMG